MRTEDYKRELITILFVQKGLIFWTTFLIFLGSALVAFYWPPTFSASSAILVKSKQPEKSPEAMESSVPRRFTEVTKADLASEIEMLTSPEVVGAAIASLSGTYPGITHGAGKDATSLPVARVLRNLATKVVPLSNVISIRYYDKNPRLAADLLNTLLEQYLKKRAAIYNVGGSGSFFQDQASRFKNQLDNNDNEIIKVLDESGSADPARELQNNLNLKLAAEGELSRLRNSYVDTQGTLKQLQDALKSEDIQYFSYLDSLVIVELAKKLTELYVERGRILNTYHPESEVAMAIDEQVRNTADALKREASQYMKNVASQLKALETKIAFLEDTISGYETENLRLGKQLFVTNKMQAESQQLRFSFETYAKRAQEELVDGSLGSTGITTRVNILNRAFPSGGPVYPRPPLVLSLGLLIGLITGISLGFLREYFDHTFKQPSDVQTYTELPVLFSLGRPENPVRSRLYGMVVIALVGLLVVFTLYNYRIWFLRYYS